MSWMAHSETPFANAQKAVIDVSGLSDQFRDGQKLRQEYEARQQQKALNEIMRTQDHAGRIEQAQQHKYAGALVPLLQKYDEDRQKAALDNLKSSADIGKTWGETSKLGAESGKIGAETTGQVIKNTGDTQNQISALAVTRDPKIFALGIGEMNRQGLITPERTEAMINLITKQPESAAAVMQSMVMANPELAKLFQPEAKVLDGKDAAYMYTVDPFTGQANEPTAKIGYGISPDNQLDNDTNRLNNQNTVAGSMYNSDNSLRGTQYSSDNSYNASVYGADQGLAGKVYGADSAAKTASNAQAVDWYKAETGASVAQQNATTAANKAKPPVGANGQVARKLESNERTKLFELQEQIDADIGVGNSLKRLDELSDEAYSGAFASFRGTAVSRLPGGGSNKRANATVLSENITIELALKQLKSTFGAAPTEGERKILMDLQASVDKSPVQKKQIIAAAMRAVSERVLYRKKQQEAIRTGSYAVPTGSSSKTSSSKTTKTTNQAATLIGNALGGG